GGRLEGSLTTKMGALAVRIPLQQVTYDKGLLRFVAAAGGAPRHFRGTLEGDTLSGSIFKDVAAKDKDAVGHFRLRYVGWAGEGRSAAPARGAAARRCAPGSSSSWPARASCGACASGSSPTRRRSPASSSMPPSPSTARAA